MFVTKHYFTMVYPGKREKEGVGRTIVRLGQPESPNFNQLKMTSFAW